MEISEANGKEEGSKSTGEPEESVVDEQAEGNAESCPHIKQPGDQGWGWGTALYFLPEVVDLPSGGESRRFRNQPQPASTIQCLKSAWAM